MHGFVLHGVTSFYIETSEGFRDSTDYLNCIVDIGSEAYMNWARENANQLIEKINTRVKSEKQALKKYLFEMPFGTLEGSEELTKQLEDWKELNTL